MGTRTSGVRGDVLDMRPATMLNHSASAVFDFIWEELRVPVAHGDDSRGAERILQEEAQPVSTSEGARRAIDEMAGAYPVPRAEVEPRVFARATDDYPELSARFVVPVRTARSTKDHLTRRALERLFTAGISVASTTEEVRVRRADGARDRGS